MIWLAWGCLSLGSALCLISLWMRRGDGSEDEELVPGGREAAIERCNAAWIDHWNNDHVKAGRPWGGQCCIQMCTDAVLGTYAPAADGASAETLVPEVPSEAAHPQEPARAGVRS